MELETSPCIRSRGEAVFHRQTYDMIMRQRVRDYQVFSVQFAWTGPGKSSIGLRAEIRERYKTKLQYEVTSPFLGERGSLDGLVGRGGDVSPGNCESPLAEKIRGMARWRK